MVKKAPVVLIGIFVTVFLLGVIGWFVIQYQNNDIPKGLLYEDSINPNHQAYHWSIHELLLSPGTDMERILIGYDEKYQQYLEYLATLDDPHRIFRFPQWHNTIGHNGHRGVVSGVDLDLNWPDAAISREELHRNYSGQFRAIPLFAYDFSEIIDYVLIGIG